MFCIRTTGSGHLVTQRKRNLKTRAIKSQKKEAQLSNRSAPCCLDVKSNPFICVTFE